MIGQSVLAFISTTMDDFVVILFLMSQAEFKNRISKRDSATKIEEKKRAKTMQYALIFIGVFLGFTIIVSISLLGMVFTFLMEPAVLDFLGLIPVVIGLQKGWDELDKRGHLDGVKSSFATHCRYATFIFICPHLYIIDILVCIEWCIGKPLSSFITSYSSTSIAHDHNTNIHP
mgnify:CR=1 FL=1